ncbi:MAG TPA: complex I NDUFA9 subunit family protein [Devosia sp.]|nr:complex I NDUFA9 subunit family protein [Devosia sp.]
MDDASRELVTVFGGSGFVGTQFIQLLAHRGYRIRAAVRRPDLAGHLRPLGDVGQVVPIQANVRDADSVRRAVAGAAVVVNLVGIPFERGRQRLETVHVAGARHVAEAAAAAGASRLVHMSVLGADPNSPSAVLRSRAQGEAAVFAAFAGAVVLRPSVIFGPGDFYFNLMGGLARALPLLPLIGASTKMQPVYVRDVAEALVIAAEGGVKGGRVYELGGPEVLTQRELVGRILHYTGRNNTLMPVGPGSARLLAAPMGLLPKPLLTADQVRQLQIDNVVSEPARRDRRTLAAFEVTPTPMDAVLPSYLWRFRKNGQFDRMPA